MQRVVPGMVGDDIACSFLREARAEHAFKSNLGSVFEHQSFGRLLYGLTSWHPVLRTSDSRNGEEWIIFLHMVHHLKRALGLNCLSLSAAAVCLNVLTKCS